VIYSLDDVPPIDKDKTGSIRNISELKQAITHTKNEWTDIGGHIILEQSFDVDANGNNPFENLQFEKENQGERYG
jgi:hypothetical protein